MKDIINKIEEMLRHAPEEDRNELAQLMEDYAERFPRTVRTLKGAGAKFWDAAEEACDARIYYN